MSLLECSCKDVTERREQSSSRMEITDKNEQGNYFKKEDIKGGEINQLFNVSLPNVDRILSPVVEAMGYTLKLAK